VAPSVDRKVIDAPTPVPRTVESAISFTSGFVQARCQRPDGSLGPVVRGLAHVASGEIVIAAGEPDQPGRVDLRGKPDADGTLVLDGFIIPVAGPARGTKVAARYEGKLTEGRGMLTGTQGMQRCSLRVQLK